MGINIAIVNYEVFPGSVRYTWEHIKPKKPEYDLKNFTFNFIELSKFNKSKDGNTDTALAILLLAHGIGVDIVVQHTTLSTEQIETLKKKNIAA